MTAYKSLADVKVGDEIVMVYRTGQMLNGKSTVRPVRATVTVAKRVNLVVQELVGDGRRWEIRRDTGKENGNSTMYGWRAYTAEAYQQKEIERQAGQFLRDQGINLYSGSPWSGREPELAALLQAYLASIS